MEPDGTMQLTKIISEPAVADATDPDTTRPSATPDAPEYAAAPQPVDVTKSPKRSVQACAATSIVVRPKTRTRAFSDAAGVFWSTPMGYGRQPPVAPTISPSTAPGETKRYWQPEMSEAPLPLNSSSTDRPATSRSGLRYFLAGIVAYSLLAGAGYAAPH